VDEATTRRLAELAVGFGANVQPGQIVAVEAETGNERIVRALADCAYERGAKFVDVTYFDPYVKRSRLEHAPEETLAFVPPWYGERMFEYGNHRCARIVVVPRISPGVLDGIDPARAGLDELPDLPERLEVINKRLVNWTAIPYPTAGWARLVHADGDGDNALAKLGDELAHILRLDEPDPIQAWRERSEALEAAAARLNTLQFDSLRFDGPGTDLTVGLLPTTRWEAARAETRDGIVFCANLPTEEVFTTPDPARAEGVVRSTKPLELAGTVIEGLNVRFEGGRAVAIDADTGAEALRRRASVDDDASRLGEVALVDREGRIGPLGTVFYNTLLDENAASHIALGNAYEINVGEADLPRINRSRIHIDFMIGGDDVHVTGFTRDGREVPVLREGRWQID
jgi:aminopeptidase